MKTYLIGFMGCGKSFLGKKMSEEQGMDFVDLDKWIEASENMSISQIFNTKGEDYFREVEKNILHQTSSLDNTIIACGGGTPCYYNNMQWMKKHGETIYLKLNVSVLFNRLSEEKSNRPLISNMTDEELRFFITNMLHKREPFYEMADKILTEV